VARVRQTLPTGARTGWWKRIKLLAYRFWMEWDRPSGGPFLLSVNPEPARYPQAGVPASCRGPTACVGQAVCSPPASSRHRRPSCPVENGSACTAAPERGTCAPSGHPGSGHLPTCLAPATGSGSTRGRSLVATIDTAGRSCYALCHRHCAHSARPDLRLAEERITPRAATPAYSEPATEHARLGAFAQAENPSG
jgi:hypothetical protein